MSPTSSSIRGCGARLMTDAALPAAAPIAQADELDSPARRARRRLFKRKAAVFGLVMITLFVGIALLAPLVVPYDPIATSWSLVRKPPTAAHWFGTDELGRDILSRVVYGARASLLAGLISVAIALGVGIPLGLLAGYRGGFVDALISRMTDALLACPFLVLAIALAAFLGPSLQNAMIAIGISAVPVFLRVARAETLVVCTEDYIAAARSQGLGNLAILTGQVLPNVLAPVIVQATLTMAIAVLAEASLAFLGLGQLPPAPSWGAMLDVARQFLGEAPWMAFWPGLAIIALVIGFNLMGDGLNDALNPRH